MKTPFVGKTVVVTGAGSGIGLLMATQFDSAGAHVLGIDIDEAALLALGSRLSDRFEGYPCDLSDPAAIEHTFAEIHSRFEGVDILVNNAGIVFSGQLEDHSRFQIEKTFAVNVFALFYCVQAVLPAMKRRNTGHIVTIASAGGFTAAPGMSAYSSSKFAAVGFEESLRFEIKKSGKNIHTTLVAPYFINTGMFDGVQTRFSWLLPVLDQEYVAHRIMKAIRKRKKRLILPRFVYLGFLLRILPVGIFDLLVDFFGITRAMDHFKGRGS